MTRIAYLFSAGIILAMVAISFYGMQNIPPDAMLPSHWNIKGEVDGYAPRNFMLAFFPVLGVVVALVCAAIPYIDPRRDNVWRSAGLYYASWFGVLGLFTAFHFVITTAAVRGTEPDSRLILLPLCVLLAVVGNFMAKSRSMWFIGLRTPWTLSSEEAWIAANRTTGWLLVVTGIAATTAAYLADAQTGFVVLAAGGLSAAAIGVAISFLVWRKERARAK